MTDDRKPVTDMTRTEIFDEATPKMRAEFAEDLKQDARNGFDVDFKNDAHPGQEAPGGDWRNWVIMAGRGFGKTRAGAEWVRLIADTNQNAKIALIAASLGEARSVMVEGESGIMSVFPPESTPVYEASLRRISFRNGAEATLYSAAEPESLRGPQHSHACRAGPERDLRQRSARPTRRAASCGGRG